MFKGNHESVHESLIKLKCKIAKMAILATYITFFRLMKVTASKDQSRIEKKKEVPWEQNTAA